MIFYALHLTTGDLVPPTEVIAIIERLENTIPTTHSPTLSSLLFNRGLDLKEDPIKSLQDNCQISTFKVRERLTRVHCLVAKIPPRVASSL